MHAQKLDQNTRSRREEEDSAEGEPSIVPVRLNNTLKIKGSFKSASLRSCYFNRAKREEGWSHKSEVGTKPRWEENRMAKRGKTLKKNKS